MVHLTDWVRTIYITLGKISSRLWKLSDNSLLDFIKYEKFYVISSTVLSAGRIIAIQLQIETAETVDVDILNIAIWLSTDAIYCMSTEMCSLLYL